MEALVTDERQDSSLKVVIACPDSRYARGLSAKLSSGEAVAVDVAGDADTLIDLTAEMDIDLAVITSDLGHDDLDELVETLSGSHRILVLGPVDDADEMLRALEAGAQGFFDRQAPIAQIIEAISSVANGQLVVPPGLVTNLVTHFIRRRRIEKRAGERLLSLTKREREVFLLAARGLSRQEIADTLYMSPGTARTHLNRLFSKLDLHSRADLVSLAAECGLADVSEDS